MSSKKFILIGVVLGGMVMANGVMAFTIQLNSGIYSKGSGGEFVACGSLSDPEYNMYYEQYDDKATYAGGFATFCLEYNEHFTPGGTYNAALNIAAVSGGGNSDPTTPGKDNISQGTAYLYSKFASGTLRGASDEDYFTTDNRKNNAGALQEAIWWLEDEIVLSDADAKANDFIKLVNSMFTDAKADYNGDSVRVMNLTTASGGVAQDQLIYVHASDGGLTVAMLGFGLAGLSAAGRRFRKS